MNFHIRRLCVLACLAVLVMPLPAFSQVTVIFSRHAEKAAAPPNDPPLTPAGERRAKVLASMLADSGVEQIFVTELQRTQQTAAPLAARVHVKPTVIPAANMDALVKAIRERKSGVVVVVGHSNTLPGIIAALDGPAVKISDTDYDNLFVLTVGATHSSLLRLHYGSSAPVSASRGEMEHSMTGGPVK
jgi:broad specificity phosphatase PhoE